MKKLAIGCGIVALVVCVAGAGVAYYLYRQVSSTVAQFAELGQIPDLERSVRNHDPFTAPASGELAEGQVEKLVQVQTEVRRRLGERMAAFEAKYRDLAQKDNASIGDVPALLRAYGELASTWLEAKRGQIDALNTAGLSLDEYRWIREQAYRALGQPYVDLDIARFVDEAQRGVTSNSHGELKGSMGPTGPESNQQRIEKFKKQLEENLALASFGL